MAQPWLDGLSDDWEQSDRALSSSSVPKSSPDASRLSQGSNASASRIPRAPNSSRKASTGNFLRPRSSRGLARGNGSPALSERSQSEMNVAAHHGKDSKILNDKPSTLPSRRTSSAFSESVSSVQHHTINKSSGREVPKGDTPEWKRRLARGDKPETDLFGPTALEGVFQQPAQNPNSSALSASLLEDKPWALPTDKGNCLLGPKTQSMRRSTTLAMDVLKEETEDESNRDNDTLPTSADLSDEPQDESVIIVPSEQVMPRKASQQFEDPRMRTVSGQEEVRNEEISPITLSKYNTVNGQPLQGVLRESIEELRSKLERVAVEERERPSSRASDKDVHYGHESQLIEAAEARQEFADITSQSLPDDLSMGTDDFASRGGYINTKRGGYSSESSFLRRNISSIEHSQQLSQFRSSPPPYYQPQVESVSELPENAPHTPSRRTAEPQSTQSSPERPSSSGSPLKLFGNYDTYTKDRLLRRMSQFEIEQESPKDESAHQEESRGEGTVLKEVESRPSGRKDGRRMSLFGKGELNDYAFTQNTTHESDISSLDSTPSQHGTIFTETIHYESASLPRTRKLDRTRTVHSTEEAMVRIEITESKRGLNSPGKERTPKRRRTLLKDELDAQQILAEQLEEARSFNERQQLAGRKRKDARYDDQGPPADPKILAQRQILRPKSTSRQGSLRDLADDPQETTPSADAVASITREIDQVSADTLTKSVAHELASFRETFNPALATRKENRVKSITTQDYFAEATKVMELIRSKQFGRSALGKLDEPESDVLGESEIEGLDEEREGDEYDEFPSTLERFSRPPSREGIPIVSKPKEPNPRVLSHLRKYKDSSDPGELEGDALFEAELPESDPPNIRILNPVDSQRKRKHSDTTASHRPSSRGSLPNTSSSHGLSTGRSIPSIFSGSSREKGFITSDKIYLPTEVGEMVFDERSKTWVKNGSKKEDDKNTKKLTNEDDPFRDIPDLSVDELEELNRNPHSPQSLTIMRKISKAKESQRGSRPHTQDYATIPPIESSSSPSKWTRIDSTAPIVETRATSWATTQIQDDKKAASAVPNEPIEIGDDHDIVEHEIRANEGRLPVSPERNADKQPRVVTIAFSSPLVSAIAYQNDTSISEEHSEYDATPVQQLPISKPSQPLRSTSRRISTSHAPRRNSLDVMGFVARPVSRIDEHDEQEEREEHEEKDQDEYEPQRSVIHVPEPGSMTPIPDNSRSRMMVPAGKDSSLISLTPLSEFTFHQTDDPIHLELSYVAHRTHPASLQQAHGQLSLAVDEMVRAITDVEPYELYWDQIRRLDLSGKKLTTVHRFSEYCSAVEELNVADNEIGQVGGLPPSLRTLSIQRNCLSDLSPWNHLHNLQYLDVSGNDIETLDGFSSLIHLRQLRANDCNIRNLDGILDLDGLLSLRLRGNQLSSVDFESSELSRLTHLDLSHNSLTAVENLHYLPALTHLDVSANQLQKFEPTRPLYKLTCLKLSSNKLSSLDLSLFPSLQLLYLDNNAVEVLPNISSHSHLETLSLRSQSNSPGLLTYILSTPSDIRNLYISANPCPNGALSSPAPLLNLQYLDMASCGVSSLAPDFGSKVPNLRVLNLNFNAIKDITPLKAIVRLNKLLAVGNRVERMRQTVQVLRSIGGRGAASLTKMDFRGNPIVHGFYSPIDLWRKDQRQWSNHSRGSSKTLALDVIESPNLAQEGDNEDNLDRAEEGRLQTLDPFVLLPQCHDSDAAYLHTLDDNTKLRRTIWWLLLNEKCRGLKQIDGLPVSEQTQTQTQDSIEGPKGDAEIESTNRKGGEDNLLEKLRVIGVLRDRGGAAVIVEGEGNGNEKRVAVEQ